MAVLLRHRAVGMSPGLYDQLAPPLIEGLKSAPGFIVHVSYVDPQGEFVVAEVWESQEQHDAWFNANVVPNVPAEIRSELVQLHSVHQP